MPYLTTSAHVAPIQSSNDQEVATLGTHVLQVGKLRQGTGVSLLRVQWLFLLVSARQGPQLSGQDGDCEI